MRTFIIAEAGVNHNGSIELAKKLIEKAAESGADAVKFQSFVTENLVSKTVKKAEYQIANTGAEETQFQMIKKLELTPEDHRVLIEHCKKNSILFLSTAFDLNSIDLLADLGIYIWKIPSGEITNLPYLKKIGSMGQKIILSTGMANLSEVNDALEVLFESGSTDITLLHCSTEYPAPIDEVNLNAMITLKNAFKLNVGYSDHTIGIEVPIAAVALGAKVIEKHFTLDKNMVGPDHKSSLEPFELRSMVNAIRNIEKAMGDGIKKPSKSEIKNKPLARKSIVAISPIKMGDVFTEDNIGIKRPGYGISPMNWELILGKHSSRDYAEDDLIEL
ncbi:N-acetylneuraminic acid synthase [Methanococcus maripaludis KA1]|jgi:N,N'-diacetyllegionaminate synthase|uniref:N-acetylneuraminic acid synthase n=1 Tax=Methanococcus maripaludis KA1 TaxID=637914 RepID=A0A2Z5PEL5_METMI|nr:N-acetylneuraminate synthase [Methanococcus maripaludis]BAP60493.1 N-acetylneuraminic acid synthase [Methanococcus maripaludis KA1]